MVFAIRARMLVRRGATILMCRRGAVVMHGAVAMGMHGGRCFNGVDVRGGVVVGQAMRGSVAKGERSMGRQYAEGVKRGGAEGRPYPTLFAQTSQHRSIELDLAACPENPAHAI